MLGNVAVQLEARCFGSEPRHLHGILKALIVRFGEDTDL